MGDQSALALSDLWESETSLRAKARTHGSLLVWANPRVVGVASTGAMALNSRCLEILADWWAYQTELPQAVPIQLVRTEVGSGNKPLSFDPSSKLYIYIYICYIQYKHKILIYQYIYIYIYIINIYWWFKSKPCLIKNVLLFPWGLLLVSKQISR